MNSRRSIDGNASDPLTGREHIAGYRIAADQSAGMQAVHNPRQPIGKGPSLTRGAKPQLPLNRNSIAQLSKIRQQTFTGIIVCAPLCAPEQAQQQSGRIGSSNTRPAPRSPPQAKASAIRSWPAPDELANLVLVALLHPQQSEAFPQSRSVCQTKQSHLTWCIGSQTMAESARALAD
jgi:hypothetical protein